MAFLENRKINFQKQIILMNLPILIFSFILIFIYIIIISSLLINRTDLIEKDKQIAALYKIIDAGYETIQTDIGIIIKNDADFLLPKQGIVVIMDQNGNLVYNNDQNSELTGILSGESLNGIIAKSGEKIILGKKVKSRIFNLSVSNSSFLVFYIDPAAVKNNRNNLKFFLFYPAINMVFIILKVTVPVLLIMLACIIMTIIISSKYGNKITDIFSRISYAISKISDGNLDMNIKSDSADEIGSLFNSLNKLKLSFIGKLSVLKRSSNDIMGYQSKIENLIRDVENSGKNQVLLLKNVTKKVDDFNNAIMKISLNINEAQGIIEQTQKHSNNSVTMLNDMKDEINKIHQISEDINISIELIDSISEKTRLLSVNSAIEASRAGDLGKGFSVVALEIKKLAAQTKEAANKITELVKKKDKIIKVGIDMSGEITEIIANIESSTKMMTDIIGQIGIETNEKSAEYNQLKSFNNTLFEQINFNLTNIGSLHKIRLLLANEINKILGITNNFTIVSDNKEVISDVSYIPGIKQVKRFKSNLPQDNFKNFEATENLIQKGEIIRSVKLYQSRKKIKK